MNAIVKPQQKIDSVGAREIEEAMKKVKEAQSLITAAIDPGKKHNCNVTMINSSETSRVQYILKINTH